MHRDLNYDLNHDPKKVYLIGIAQQLVPDWNDPQLFSDWTYLEGGYSNDNYAFSQNGARFVLRIPRGQLTPESWQKELAWYGRLTTEVGVQPIAFNADTGQMITPWVNGILLVDLWNKQQLNPQPSDSVITRLSQYLKTLHNQLPITENRYSNSMEMASGGYITCHNDLNPWNIIVADDDHWVTLDWEWVGLNDPIFDVVSLHQGLELNGGLLQLCQLYLGANTNNLYSRLSKALQAYWKRQLTWAEKQIDGGNDRDEIITQRTTAAHKLNSLQDIY